MTIEALGHMAAKAERGNEAIGRRLRLARLATGLNQKQYARSAGLAYTTYNNWESGLSRPELDAAHKLCDVYGLSLDWLYRDEPSGLAPELHAAIVALQGTMRRR